MWLYRRSGVARRGRQSTAPPPPSAGAKSAAMTGDLRPHGPLSKASSAASPSSGVRAVLQRPLSISASALAALPIGGAMSARPGARCHGLGATSSQVDEAVAPHRTVVRPCLNPTCRSAAASLRWQATQQSCGRPHRARARPPGTTALTRSCSLQASRSKWPRRHCVQAPRHPGRQACSRRGPPAGAAHLLAVAGKVGAAQRLRAPRSIQRASASAGCQGKSFGI